MRYSLRTLLVIAAIGPPLLAGACVLARWWYLDWRPGHEAELEFYRGTRAPPLVDQLGIIDITDRLVPDWRENEEQKTPGQPSSN